MTALDGWVTVPIRGQLDGIGPKNDIDDAGAYPLTISVRQDNVPALLQQLVKATITAAADEATPIDHPAVLRMFADQLSRAYDWRSLDEQEKEDPEAATSHKEAAEELWPWLTKGTERDRSAAFRRGFDKGRERGYERAREENAADSAHIQYATEFRIPCPDAADPGRPEGGPVLQPEPLIVQKVTANWADRFPDGWLILNPNLQPGDHVWTGDRWVYRGQLHMGVIYRWSRGEAIVEAQRLAPEETHRYEGWLAEQRAAARKGQS